MFISGFVRRRPKFLVSQQDSLYWLAEAHARRSGEVSAEKFKQMISRFGCDSGKILQRGTYLRDFTHLDWPEMRLFREPAGASLRARMAFYQETLMEEANALYPEDRPDFNHWIHVSCTGYTSPSVIQTLVSQRDWGQKVQCLHAYHMGCLAAFPALRMARGNLDCEILHSELCTLHVDPANHDPGQLVVQSLFADGVIRYRVTADQPSVGFEVLELKEMIAPNSLEQMTWEVADQGFEMTLSRHVPRSIEVWIGDMIKSWKSPQAVYAIHPGGPRIIDMIQETLSLSDEQVFASREVLRLHGNMSSATLPHVWQNLLEILPANTPVISMAFGPGLTLAASLMRKVGAS